MATVKEGFPVIFIFQLVLEHSRRASSLVGIRFVNEKVRLAEFERRNHLAQTIA